MSRSPATPANYRQGWVTSATVLLFVSVPVGYIGGRLRNADSAFEDYIRSYDQALPPGPRFPLAALLFPGLWALCCGCGNFVSLAVLAAGLRVPQDEGVLGVLLRGFLSILLGVVAAFHLGYFLENLMWEFWVLALSELLATAGIGCAIAAIWSSGPKCAL